MVARPTCRKTWFVGCWKYQGWRTWVDGLGKGESVLWQPAIACPITGAERDGKEEGGSEGRRAREMTRTHARTRGDERETIAAPERRKGRARGLKGVKAHGSLV